MGEVRGKGKIMRDGWNEGGVRQNRRRWKAMKTEIHVF